MSPLCSSPIRPSTNPPPHHPIYPTLYDAGEPAASAIDTAFASATLFMSPCLPFCSMTVSPWFYRQSRRVGKWHSRSTWRISIPSLLSSRLPIACHLSSFVGRLVRRRRGICCSWGENLSVRLIMKTCPWPLGDSRDGKN